MEVNGSWIRRWMQLYKSEGSPGRENVGNRCAVPTMEAYGCILESILVLDMSNLFYAHVVSPVIQDDLDSLLEAYIGYRKLSIVGMI